MKTFTIDNTWQAICRQSHLEADECLGRHDDRVIVYRRRLQGWRIRIDRPGSESGTAGTVATIESVCGNRQRHTGKRSVGTGATRFGVFSQSLPANFNHWPLWWYQTTDAFPTNMSSMP